MEPEVIFCGYVINGNGVKPVADKVDTISNAPEPKGVSQLRTFLGLLNYYHRFLPDLSTVLEALGETWRWGAEQREAFEKAKTLLQSAELLVHFGPTKKLILASDACSYGIGAVLSQRMRDGSERHEP